MMLSKLDEDCYTFCYTFYRLKVSFTLTNKTSEHRKPPNLQGLRYERIVFQVPPLTPSLCRENSQLTPIIATSRQTISFKFQYFND